MGQVMRIPYKSDGVSVYDVQDLNSTFAKCSIKVMYTGENRNGSVISRNATERALHTLYNVPIVCHWMYEKGVIGSHDIELAHDTDGNPFIRNLTEPCGVVPESAKFSFRVEEDANGVAHEYLVVDGALLWKRQDVYMHIVNDLCGRVDHSMEINVMDGTMDDRTGRYHIADYEFTALCLLETAEPCFEGSELRLYAADQFKNRMEEMMADLRSTYSQISAEEQNPRCCFISDHSEKGGDVLERKNQLLERYGAEIEGMGIDAESATYEELFEALKKGGHIIDDILDDEDPVNPEENAKGDNEDGSESSDESNGTGGTEEQPSEEQAEYALSCEIRCSIEEALAEIMIDTEFGEMPRYCVVDYDAEVSRVYCYDMTDWLMYGFMYAMEGDRVVIDYESKKRVKWTIVDYDGGEQDSPAGKIFSVAIQRFCASKSEWEQRLQAASNEADAMREELTTLRQFRNNVESERANAERQKIFERFDDLSGIDAFNDLVSNAGKYSAEELEEKCFALRGRYKAQAKFSNDGRQKVIVLPRDGALSDEPYGGAFKQYRVE